MLLTIAVAVAAYCHYSLQNVRKCVECPRAYHKGSACNLGGKTLSKKLFLCAEHDMVPRSCKPANLPQHTWSPPVNLTLGAHTTTATTRKKCLQHARPCSPTMVSSRWSQVRLPHLKPLPAAGVTLTASLLTCTHATRAPCTVPSDSDSSVSSDSSDSESDSASAGTVAELSDDEGNADEAIVCDVCDSRDAVDGNDIVCYAASGPSLQHTHTSLLS